MNVETSSPALPVSKQPRLRTQGTASCLIGRGVTSVSPHYRILTTNMPSTLQQIGRGGSEIHEMGVHQSEQDDVAIHTPTQVGQGQIQAEEQTHNSGVHTPCDCGGPDDLTETQRGRGS